MHKFFVLLVFIYTDAFGQELKDYAPDTYLHSVTHLSKKLSFIYGLDNQSVDYYKIVDKNHSIFYNLETETFSLKEDKSNLILDQLNLYSVKEFKHHKRLLGSVNSNRIVAEYKGVSTSIMGTIKQVTNLCYNYGLVRTSKGLALLQIKVDTINYKLSYGLIPLYDDNFRFFVNKHRKNNDTMFSSSLFEGSIYQILMLGGDKIINCNFNPITVSDEPEFKTTFFVSRRFNSLEKCKPFNGSVIDVVDGNRLLSVNADSSIVCFYDSTYTLVNKTKIKLDSSLRKMKLLKNELITDQFTSDRFIYLRFKGDSLVDVIYNLNNLNKYIYKITSNEWFNIMDIRNGTILIDLIHPVDKHIYVYAINKKISKDQTLSERFVFRSIPAFGPESSSVKGYGRGFSLFYSKLMKMDKSYITGHYELLDSKRTGLLKVMTDTVLETKRETMQQLMATVINYSNAKLYLTALTKLFIYRTNTTDTLIYKLIDEHQYGNIEKGVNEMAGLISDISYFPNEYPGNENCEVNLCTNSGYILTFVRYKRKWYCAPAYYRKMD